MDISSLDRDDIIKLKHCIESGTQVLNDIEQLRESMKETVEAVSEELDIPKKFLNKAIRLSYRQQGTEESRKELDVIEELLEAAGA